MLACHGRPACLRSAGAASGGTSLPPATVPPVTSAGRADYFGSVPNLAARLMAVAQPGQMLVDGRLNSLPSLQVTKAW